MAQPAPVARSTSGGVARAAEPSGPLAVAGWIAFVVAVSSLPYLFLWRSGGRFGSSDGVYAWILPPYPEDLLSYLSWVKQAADGALLFHLKFTQIEHGAVIFQPVFLLAGWLSVLLGLDAGATLFLVLRPLAVGGFLWALYRFALVFPLSHGERWTFLWLTVCASGLGILFGPQPLRPADLWMPEFNTLWTLVWNPLFAVSLTLMLLVFILVARAEEGRAAGSFLAAGALTGLLAFVHPYDVVTTGLVVVVWTLYRYRRRSLAPLLLYAFVAVPPGLVQAGISMGHPLLSAHRERGGMASPSPLSYAVAFGLPGLLAAFGALRARRDGRLGALSLAWLWLLVSLASAYAPVWFQRKLVMGVHVPACLLAAIGLVRLADAASCGRRSLRATFIAAVALATTPTHFHNARRMAEIVSSDITAYYRAPGVDRALRWLDQEVPPDAVVLAHPSLARAIPGASGQFVTHGHWAQSVDLREQRRRIGLLFGPRSSWEPDRKQAELRASRVGYVFVDEVMLRRWMGGTVPVWLDEAGTTVYREAGVSIIRVDRPDD